MAAKQEQEPYRPMFILPYSVYMIRSEVRLIVFKINRPCRNKMFDVALGEGRVLYLN